MTAQDVADALRSAIETGEYRPGHQLPSKAAVRREFGISVATAQEVFNTLGREGLITGRRGAGVFVRHPARHTTVEALISGFDELEHDVAEAPAWVAAALRLEIGTAVDRGHQVTDDRLFTEWAPQVVHPNPTWSERYIQARAAAPDERELLDLRAGTPVLALHRTFYSDDGQAVRADRVTAVGAAYTVDLGQSPVG
ncbi:GntR family transcriptional regulator [Saccharopolyspora taberi]|uniref:GntR family transcriptional regulator n=1 Tax=Saccharopolyspora taberi TaxID=60895 RepID=A0ABN3VP21_9PSEU